jgi:hypothetical protein
MTQNKTYKNFIRDMKAIYPLKPKYQQYFDVVASLYIDRKIEKKSQVEKLLEKLSGRGKAPESAIKLIEKYKGYKSVKGIIKGTKRKAFHLEAKIKCKIVYKHDNYSYIETFIESKRIIDYTIDEAKQQKDTAKQKMTMHSD